MLYPKYGLAMKVWLENNDNVLLLTVTKERKTEFNLRLNEDVGEM